MCNLSFVEYIWLDGHSPTQGLRSKTRLIELSNCPLLIEFPVWSFDGSSTGQAKGKDGDCLLEPARVYPDPLRGPGHYLVLCEVLNPDASPHSSNRRANLRLVLDSAGTAFSPWLGFQQGYTLHQNDGTLRSAVSGAERPPGSNYCGVGNDRVAGRELVEEHAEACLRAEIMLYGHSAQAMPGQWEFQIGYRGGPGEAGEALTVCDDVWLARFLLHRISEHRHIDVSFADTSVANQSDGAGLHTNFSTVYMRNPRNGLEVIEAVVNLLSGNHDQHLTHYGNSNIKRLRGEYGALENAGFCSGVGDRHSSIRIPRTVALQGCGHLEDRRPGADADPYSVASCLIGTACGEPHVFQTLGCLKQAANI